MPLPMFTPDDVLPVGDYELTLDELRHSHLVTGQDNPSENWDVQWRYELVMNLTVMAQQLWQVGVSNIFVDGSFVENKDHPNDIDGYFECGLRYFASRSHRVNCMVTSTHLTRTRSGLGPRLIVVPMPTRQNDSYPCGTSIMLSYTRTTPV